MVEDTVEDVHESYNVPEHATGFLNTSLSLPSEHQDEPPRRSTDHQLASAAPFGEQLKYTLATSSLLTPRLAEAIPAYPSPEEDIQSPARSITTAVQNARANGTIAAWGVDWDTQGQRWRDRSLLDNLSALAWRTVGLVRRAASSAPLKTPVTPHQEAAPAHNQAPAPTHCANITVAAAEAFVQSAQRLDLRVSQALTGVREIECINWGLRLYVRASSPGFSLLTLAVLPDPTRFRPCLASRLKCNWPRHNRWLGHQAERRRHLVKRLPRRCQWHPRRCEP
jgi:hypothetical protein